MGLGKWFKEEWVDIGSPKKVVAMRVVVEKKPKALKENTLNAYPKQLLIECLSQKKKSAVSRKRSKKQGVGGKPTNVKTFAK